MEESESGGLGYLATAERAPEGRRAPEKKKYRQWGEKV